MEALSSNPENEQLIHLMGKADLLKARVRLVAQGGVKLNGEKQTDPKKR